MSSVPVKRMLHGVVVTRRYDTCVVRKDHSCIKCHNTIRKGSGAWTYAHEQWVHLRCFDQFVRDHADHVIRMKEKADWPT
jgi:hypothetical protein